jgi:hypothetical protein
VDQSPQVQLPVARLPRHLQVKRTESSGTAMWLIILVVALQAAMFIPGFWLLAPSLIPAVFALFVWRKYDRNRLWNDSVSDGRALLVAHELDEAEEVFTYLAKRMRGMGPHRAIAVYFLAVIARLRGDLVEAEAILRGLVGNPQITHVRGAVSHYCADLYGELALVLALRGEVDEAAERLELAAERVSEARAGRLMLARAVILARRQEWGPCTELIEDEGRTARELLRPHDARALALVEALALSRHAGHGYREVADSRQVEDALRDSQPRRTAEFDYLGLAWPQMHAFLEMHEIE